MSVDSLKIHIRTLKNADPHTFDRLLKALGEYATEVTVAVTEAPTENILVAQGRAQMARKLFQLFSELPS